MINTLCFWRQKKNNSWKHGFALLLHSFYSFVYPFPQNGKLGKISEKSLPSSKRKTTQMRNLYTSPTFGITRKWCSFSSSARNFIIRVWSACPPHAKLQSFHSRFFFRESWASRGFLFGSKLLTAFASAP